MSLEEAFEQFKKLPDWERFPMPEVFYTHFGVKKPKPAEIGEYLNYTPPPAKYERPQIRKPMPGGVREVPTLPDLPVETYVDPDAKPQDWEVIDQNPALPGVETPLQKAYSIESNATKNQPLEVPNGSNLPVRDVFPDTVTFASQNDAS